MQSKKADNPEVEKAKSSKAGFWGGWSRSSEHTQESRSNDPASEGLHIVWLTIVLQARLGGRWFWIVVRSSNTLDYEEPYDGRLSQPVPFFRDTVLWEV